MNLTPEYMAGQLPQANPPVEFLNRELIGLAEQIRNPLTYRSFLWTAAIFQEMRQGDFYFDLDPRYADGGGLPPFLWHWDGPFRGWPRGLLSMYETYVGFFDPEAENGGFGVAIHFYQGNASYLFRGLLHFRRFDASIPVISRRLTPEQHVFPADHPHNGVAGCWVQHRTSRQKGILTAKHCTNGIAIGGRIRLASGQFGKIMDKTEGIVDAAWIDPGAGYPSTTSPFPVNYYPVGGTTADLMLPAGKLVATVAGVTDTMGVFGDHNLPSKVFFDKSSVPGDSGSLTLNASGEAIAIYAGEMKNATYNGQTNATLGYGQHMGQAVTMMTLDLIQ